MKTFEASVREHSGGHRRRRNLPGRALPACSRRRPPPCRSTSIARSGTSILRRTCFSSGFGRDAIVGASPEMLVRVEGRQHRDSPDRRHPPSRQGCRGGRAACRGAVAEREGTSRARHARGSRPQRCGPGRGGRQRSRGRVHGRSRATHTSCIWSRAFRAGWRRTAIGSMRWRPRFRPAR